jgi:membrane fusion protein, copper/silver efflux system
MPSTRAVPDPAAPAARARRAVRIVALMAAPVAAVAIAWWLTRGPRAPADADGAGHDHAAMAAPAGDAGPVMLSADQARRIGVTFAAVTAGVLPHDVRTVGRVVADETRLHIVSPRVDGWAERLHADFTGQLVRAGAPLLELYSPAVVSAQEELLLARRLAADLTAGDARALAEAESLVASARRRLLWWEVPEEEIARIERTGEVHRTVLLRVPVSGVVLDKQVIAGQRVMAGVPLYRIADLSTVWIEGDVYEQDLRALAVGQAAVAEFDAYPGERWTGRIAYVQPTVAEETRTVRVRVTLANPGLRLKPGMFATLRLTGAGRPATLSVPRSAVLATGERSMVFVRLDDGRLAPREVETGFRTSDRVEILRGLAVGDTVVASATFLVDAESNLGTALGGMGDMPGMEITVPPTAAPAKAAPAKAAPAPRTPPDHSHEDS